jgi:hypothetical protein
LAEAIEVAARTRMGDVMVHVSSRGRFEWRESYLDMSVSDYHKIMGSQYCHALGEGTVDLWYRKTLPRKLAKVYEIDSWTPNMELMAC